MADRLATRVENLTPFDENMKPVVSLAGAITLAIMVPVAVGAP
jgi:hypothetical protein